MSAQDAGVSQHAWGRGGAGKLMAPQTSGQKQRRDQLGLWTCRASSCREAQGGWGITSAPDGSLVAAGYGGADRVKKAAADEEPLP